MSLITLVYLLCSAAFGFALGRAADLPWPTAVVATTPGGIGEMALTAQALQLGVPIVSAFHAIRMARRRDCSGRPVPHLAMVVAATMIELRPLTRASAPPPERFLAAVEESSVALARWMPWYHMGYGLSDVERWYDEADRMWSDRKAFPMLIVESVDGALLGGIALHDILLYGKREGRDGLLGTPLRMRSWRRGHGDADDGRIRFQ